MMSWLPINFYFYG